MRRPRWRGAVTWRRRALACGLALVLGTAGGCATADRSQDVRIEAEVKARLVAQGDANLTRLGVVSTAGTVYLSGAVESERQKTLAERLAGDVPGVQRVVSALEVRPATR